MDSVYDLYKIFTLSQLLIAMQRKLHLEKLYWCMKGTMLAKLNFVFSFVFVNQLKDIAEKQAPDVNLKDMLTDAESLLIAKQINLSACASALISTSPPENRVEDPGNSAHSSAHTAEGSWQHHTEEAISLRRHAMEANDQSHKSSDVSSSQKFVDARCD